VSGRGDSEAVEILGVPQSIYVRTVRMACEEKGITARLNAVPPHSPEVLAINPFGTIPALRHGAISLFESKAIVCYLDAVFDGPRLIPAEPAMAGETEQWVSALNTRVIPCWVRYTRCYFQSGRRRPTPDRAGIDALMPEVESHFAILERAVTATAGVVCGRFTLADLALLPILDYLAELEETRAFLTATRLGEYLAEQRRRPSFAVTAPPTG
jgi:glutathione S-transferase